MATSNSQRQRQRQRRRLKRLEEVQLDRKNEYGITDPTPFEAVGNIIRAQRDRETTRQHTTDLA